jgi:peptide-methionine (S)-S-oxide reductase
LRLAAIPLAVLVILALFRWLGGGPQPVAAQSAEDTFALAPAEAMDLTGMEVVTLGGGCFWCVEAVYERVDGIVAAVSGYAGGDVERPDYYQVVRGNTGHAEVVQIVFDPEVISLQEVMDLFFRAHDPTTLNRQGNDVGPHYRSIVLYHNQEQRPIVETSLARAQETLSKPIVTQVEPLEAFYPAEVYHQDYFEKNPDAAYCTFVIRPKLQELDLM